jgi:hypothetical protein
MNLVPSDGQIFSGDFRIGTPEADGKTQNGHFREMLLRARSDERLQPQTVLFDFDLLNLTPVGLLPAPDFAFALPFQ